MTPNKQQVQKKIVLKKKLTKFSNDQVLVQKGWFIGLKEIADKFEKKPTDLNRMILLGFISSAEFIIENL